MKTEKCSICGEINLRSMIGIDGRCQKCLHQTKSYELIIHGDDMFDKSYVKVITIEAETLKEAMELAYDQNGVYDVEPVDEEEL